MTPSEESEYNTLVSKAAYGALAFIEKQRLHELSKIHIDMVKPTYSWDVEKLNKMRNGKD